MLCPHMSSEPINILRGNILEGVSLGFRLVTAGSLIVWRSFAYCSQTLGNRDGKSLMNNLGGCEWETKEGLSTGFFDLWGTDQGGGGGWDRAEADLRWVSHDADPTAQHQDARPSTFLCVFLTDLHGVPSHVNLPNFWAFVPAAPLSLECHTSFPSPFYLILSCLETQLRCLLPPTSFHNPVVPSIYSYTVYHTVQFSLNCLYSLPDSKLLKGPVCISLMALFLTPRAAPGTWQMLTSCLVNKQLMPVLKRRRNTINVVVVAVEGGEFFTLAVSTREERSPATLDTTSQSLSLPGHASN